MQIAVSLAISKNLRIIQEWLRGGGSSWSPEENLPSPVEGGNCVLIERADAPGNIRNVLTQNKSSD